MRITMMVREIKIQNHLDYVPSTSVFRSLKKKSNDNPTI